jgi:hypothetical protein
MCLSLVLFDFDENNHGPKLISRPRRKGKPKAGTTPETADERSVNKWRNRIVNGLLQLANKRYSSILYYSRLKSRINGKLVDAWEIKGVAIECRNRTTMTIAEPIQHTAPSVKRNADHGHYAVKRGPDYGYDAAQAVKRNPDYGYDGRIDSIRKTEYAHLGGTYLPQYHIHFRYDLHGPRRGNPVSHLINQRTCQRPDLDVAVKSTLSLGFRNRNR